ncbi:response regulator, partial [Streptomyces sp. SID625]|nr:response regulator [Streptomyces sp. SID625]
MPIRRVAPRPPARDQGGTTAVHPWTRAKPYVAATPSSAPAAPPNLPVIMLTARGDDSDIVTGLEAGADDYVVKPVAAPVLQARIRAALRRAEPSARPGPDADLAGLVIDRAGLTVT